MKRRLRPIDSKFRGMRLLVAMALLLIAGACSTTRRLTEGETLYTGVRKLEINPSDKEKLPSGMVDNLKQAINVAPNNPMPFLSPYYRLPLPIGLWVYNNVSDSAKGFKGWIYRTFAKTPVLISDVRPEARTEMLKNILENNGYFGSTAEFDLNYSRRNPKKASITYSLDVSKPYTIDSIQYIGARGAALAVGRACAHRQPSAQPWLLLFPSRVY